MSIVTLGIDLGKNLNSVVAWIRRGRSFCAGASGGRRLRNSPAVFHPALSPWRRAAAPIMSVVSLPRKDMMSD